MDEGAYETNGDWQIALDGNGVTLAKRDQNLASAAARAWIPSATIGGTHWHG